MATNINLKGITELNITGITSPSISKGVVSFTISQPAATTWDSIGNAAGNLTLANAGYTTTFNQTSAVAWTWANTTTATSGTTNASPLLEVAANYWTGAASAASIWTLGSSLAAGSNAAETFAITRLLGNTGTPTFAFQTQVQTAPNSLVQQISGYPPTGSGTAATSIFGSNNTAGNLLVVFACWDTSGLTATIADSIGNSWTTPGARQANGTAFSQVWYCLNCKGGANTVTVSYSGGTATFFAQSAAEFTGVDTFEQLIENTSTSQALTTSHNALQLVIGCTNGVNGTYGAATGSISYFLPVGGRCVMDFWPNASIATYTQSSTGSQSGATGHILSFYKTAGLVATNNQIMTVTPTALTMNSPTLGTTVSVNSSPSFVLNAQYWTGVASAADTWTIGSSLAAGTNGTSTLTIAHGGSTGIATLKTAAALNLTLASSQTQAALTLGADTNAGWVQGNSTAGNWTYIYAGYNSFTVYGNFARFNANGGITWTASATNAANGGSNAIVDSGISRLGAASLAIGNGTAGDTTGNLSLNNIIKYGGVATVRSGVAAEYAKSDLTAQSAAITATTLYATTATGAYRISWSAAITTASDTSSVLGGANGFQVLYTSPTDSVVKTTVAGNSVTSAANTTGTALGGSIIVYAKTGTNIQYQYGYTSVQTSVSMAYELHITVEAL
jgi:hypothetical protein